ncbi:hypothetical protein NC653_007696 [Populus alba x Populus x berolinensis]|uniref:Uncharacterized protein n=1 Tax=Populus alba x Populus x berolinensis TaxID=444605 RepID=A0AAD6RIH0_9ROSI|nr:hypothetical protein NC653_007696 [Populus alba x Populus x berolinensis]
MFVSRRLVSLILALISYLWVEVSVAAESSAFCYGKDTEPVATLMDSTTLRFSNFQKAFAELESHRAILKRRFHHELEDQEKASTKTKTRRAREILEKRESAVVAQGTSFIGEALQEKQDACCLWPLQMLYRSTGKYHLAETSAAKCLMMANIPSENWKFGVYQHKTQPSLVLGLSQIDFYPKEVANVDGKKDSTLFGFSRLTLYHG